MHVETVSVYLPRLHPVEVCRNRRTKKKKVLPVSVAEQERILKPNTDVRVIHCLQM